MALTLAQHRNCFGGKSLLYTCWQMKRIISFQSSRYKTVHPVFFTRFVFPFSFFAPYGCPWSFLLVGSVVYLILPALFSELNVFSRLFVLFFIFLPDLCICQFKILLQENALVDCVSETFSVYLSTSHSANNSVCSEIQLMLVWILMQNKRQRLIHSWNSE